MPRGIYKRKKVGRPKNKIISAMHEALADLKSDNPKAKMTTWHIATEPSSFLSRLEAATIKYEQAIKEAIEALKGQ